jgi:hypothetical protein
MGDSQSFGHVPLQSWGLAGLAGMLGNTFTMHSNGKTGELCSGRECDVMVFPSIPKFRCPVSLLFWTQAHLQILHCSCSLFHDTILNLFFIMTGITQKWQVINSPATSHRKIDWKWMARKFLITYHHILSTLTKHMGLCPLQDCKERRCWNRNKNTEKIVLAILQESTTQGLHPLSNFCVGDSVSLQIQGKYNCILSTMAFFLIASGKQSHWL